MSFRLSTIQEYNRFIAVDIGSYKIRVLICEIENGSLKLLWKASVRQSRNHMLDGDISDMQWVAETIQKAILKAWSHLEEIPTDIITSFSSRTMPYDILTMNYTRSQKDAKVTLDELDVMIKRVEGKSFDRIRNKLLEYTGDRNTDIRLISSSLTSIFIDGKRIANPTGFIWKDIRFTVMNIYTSTSDFSSIHSVLNSLDRKTISVVPSLVLYPKIIEKSASIFDTNVYLDIGYHRVNIVYESHNEIIWSIVVPFWLALLELEISKAFPEMSMIDIENNIIALLELSKSAILKNEKYREMSIITNDFLEMIGEYIIIGGEKVSKELVIKNLFLCSASASNQYITQYWKDFFKNTTHHAVSMNSPEVFLWETKIEIEYYLATALAEVASELLLAKKDPIIRILRYIIYQYD